MTEQDFIKLGTELQTLSKTIPLQWGKIQNDQNDAKFNMFKINNLALLESTMNKERILIEQKPYYRRRWFLWQCSKIDEYLFYREKNAMKNPNKYDKNWDIQFLQNKDLQFDIKGTLVPKVFRNSFSLNNEKQLIEFYYNNQSKGVRFGKQNRLFIVHHSYKKVERSIFLRCYWELKSLAYKHFISKLKDGIKFIEIEKAISKCIFIIETKDNKFTFYINE